MNTFYRITNNNFILLYLVLGNLKIAETIVAEYINNNAGDGDKYNKVDKGDIGDNDGSGDIDDNDNIGNIGDNNDIDNSFVEMGEYLINTVRPIIKIKNQGCQSVINFFEMENSTHQLINEKLEIKIDNIIIKKKFIEIGDKITNILGGDIGQMNREVSALLKLYKKKHFPILLSKCNLDKYIYMNNCGTPLSNDNIPTNWKEQILEIIKTLKKYNVSNNDMWKNNFLVNNGIINLVDFGWATNELYFPYINITNFDVKKFDNIINLLDHVYERVLEQRILFTTKLIEIYK